MAKRRLEQIKEELLAERKFLQLFYDENIKYVHVNRTLDSALKEVLDLSQALELSTFVTHLSHHRDTQEATQELRMPDDIASYQSRIQELNQQLQPLNQQLQPITNNPHMQSRQQQLQQQISPISQQINRCTIDLAALEAKAKGLQNHHIIEVLQANKHLVFLDLANTFMGPALVKHIGNMLQVNTVLTFLDLKFNSLDAKSGEIIGASLKGNTSITHLDISNNPLLAQGIKAIADALKGNTSVTYLNVARAELKEQGAQFLSAVLERNKTLKHFDISNNDIKAKGVECILEALAMPSVDATDTAEVVISDKMADSSGTDVFAEAPDLFGLSMTSADGADEAAVDVFANKQVDTNSITYLNLSQNAATPRSGRAIAAFLAASKSITFIDLTQNQLTTEGLMPIENALRTNGSLTTLDISSNDIKTEGGQVIGSMLRTNGVIQSLSIANNAIGYAGTKPIAEALKVNATLVDLDAKETCAGEAGAILIAKALEVNRHLTCLDFTGNQILDAGAIFLASSLAENKLIRVLNLSKNGITDKGLEALSEGLDSVVRLDLSHNAITANGTQHLVQLLSSPKASIIYLNLSQNNGIGVEGVKIIATALGANHSLLTLEIAQVGMGDQGMQHLVSVLQHNMSLIKVNIGRNNICQAGAKSIADIFRENVVLSNIDLANNPMQQPGEKDILSAILDANTTVLEITGFQYLDAADKKALQVKLMRNNELLRGNLDKLATGDTTDFTPKQLFIIAKQLQAQMDSGITPTELATLPLQHPKFYLEKIVAKAKELAARPTSMDNPESEAQPDIPDIYLKELVDSVIIGHVEVGTDAIM